MDIGANDMLRCPDCDSYNIDTYKLEPCYTRMEPIPKDDTRIEENYCQDCNWSNIVVSKGNNIDLLA
jgi:hypothetical protein